MAYHGKFKPKNPKKYKGNLDKIEWRSSWELGFMRYCDENPHIIRWNSEEIVIPYRSVADENKLRRYFVDFWVKYEDGREFIFEIKPFKETQPPIPPGKMTEKARQRFLKEVYTYQVNKDKWNAAHEAATKKGWLFKVLTEKTLPKFGVLCS